MPKVRGQETAEWLLGLLFAFICRASAITAVVLVISGLVGAMTSSEERRVTMDAIHAAAASTYTTAVLWSTVRATPGGRPGC